MKRLIIALLINLRLLALWRYCSRKKITILMLHGVADERPEGSWRPLWERPTPQQLESTIRQIGEYYSFISLDDAVRILDGLAPPVDYGLVVTFDDGYRNNFSEALPVLEKLNVPATFFIATGYVETGQSYWIDRLDYALQMAPDDRRLLRGRGYEFDLRGLDRKELTNEYRQLRQSIKENESEDESMLRVVDEMAESLETASEFTIKDIIDTDPYVSVATWAEQSAACEGGATIGSHSVDHCRLTSIPRSAVDGQIIDSKNEIEEKLGGACEFFCYPNGSLDEYVLERVKKAGYRAAVTTVHGLNCIGDDLRALKRYPMPWSENTHKNLLEISGILESRIAKALLGTR